MIVEVQLRKSNDGIFFISNQSYQKKIVNHFEHEFDLNLNLENGHP